MNKQKLGLAIAVTAALAVIVALAWRPVGRTDTHTTQQVVAIEAPSAQVQARGPVTRAPASRAREAAPRALLSEWRQLLTGNIDFLQFLKAAVPAAKAGDGRAAWYIGQGLNMCMRALNGIYGGTPISFEAQLQQELAQMHPNTPQYLKDEHEREARRCFSLANAKENP